MTIGNKKIMNQLVMLVKNSKAIVYCPRSRDGIRAFTIARNLSGASKKSMVKIEFLKEATSIVKVLFS